MKALHILVSHHEISADLIHKPYPLPEFSTLHLFIGLHSAKNGVQNLEKFTSLSLKGNQHN